MVRTVRKLSRFTLLMSSVSVVKAIDENFLLENNDLFYLVMLIEIFIFQQFANSVCLGAQIHWAD